MIIPSIPKPARIMNPVEGSELNVPRQTRLGKLMRPNNRLANQNILYLGNPSAFRGRDLSKDCFIVPFNSVKIPSVGNGTSM